MQVYEEVLTGTSWKLWDSALKRKAPGTSKIYLRHFTNFLKSIDMDSEEFYQAYSEAIGREKIVIQSMVLDRVRSLEEEGYSSSASHQTIKSVSSFLKSNGESFTSQEKHKRHSLGSRIIEKSEIRLLLEKTTNYRNKALILVLRDSGLRVSDVAQITYGHLSECLRKGVDFCLFTLVQEKTKQPVPVCLGYESLEYIRLWLDERKKRGETLTPESPLWITLHPRPDIGIKVGEKLSKYTISSRIRAIVAQAGLEGVSAHSLRKYFVSRMMINGMHESLVNIFVGKTVGESKSPYIHYSNGQLLEEYKAHYKAISFETTGREEIEELREKLRRFEIEREDMIKDAVLEMESRFIEKMAEQGIKLVSKTDKKNL